MQKITDFYKKYRFVVFIVLFIFNATLLALLSQQSGNYPEVVWVNNNKLDFPGLQKYFKDLSEKKGGEYAFNVLRNVNLPDGTDVHLLAHTVGDILYKQKKVEGIKICTDDFRNACSHSIVIGMFIENGIDAITDIAKACREAPGGTGAYAMCFHGLGHGILAYAQYDMQEAINLCRKVGSSEFNYVESAECVGGIVMEMVNGVHDKAAWEKQKDNYFRKDDPLYPCNQGFIPSNARFYCFWYLTPHLWEFAGGDFSNPVSKDFEAAFKYCSKLSGDKEEFKEACYGGFGKEFVVFASGDIRKVETMNESQVKQIYDWCLLADVKEGIKFCIAQSINSLYWGGEHSPNSALLLCNQITDTEYNDMCFTHLAGSFNFYKSGRELHKECQFLSDKYKDICLTRKQ